MTHPDDLAAWVQGLPPTPPPDVVPPARTRPTREVVAALLGTDHGQQITMTEHKMIEDVDGIPTGIETVTTSGSFARPSLEQLGWTQAEWDDASVTR